MRVITAKRVERTGGNMVIAIDKNPRGPNWEVEEKATLLAVKLKFLVNNMLHSQGRGIPKYDKSWAHHVSAVNGRAMKSCQGQWDNLLRSRNAIRDHESKINAGTISSVSFWKMNEEDPEKQKANKERKDLDLELLPKVFPRNWYVQMETISQLVEAAKRNPSLKIVGGNFPSSSTAHITSIITGSDDSPQGPLDGSQPSSFHDRNSMDPPVHLVSTQAGKQRAEDEVLALRLQSYVTKQVKVQVEKEIIPLLPRQEENEQECPERLLAIKQERLALKRKEVVLLERLVAVKEQEAKRPKTDYLEAVAHPRTPNYDHTNVLQSSQVPANGGVGSAHSQNRTCVPFFDSTCDITFGPGQHNQMLDPNAVNHQLNAHQGQQPNYNQVLHLNAVSHQLNAHQSQQPNYIQALHSNAVTHQPNAHHGQQPNYIQALHSNAVTHQPNAHQGQQPSYIQVLHPNAVTHQLNVHQSQQPKYIQVLHPNAVTHQLNAHQGQQPNNIQVLHPNAVSHQLNAHQGQQPNYGQVLDPNEDAFVGSFLDLPDQDVH